MTTAQHLRLIDAMRALDVLTERIRSGSGVSGPGYHTVSLHADVDHWDDDEVRRMEHRAQCLAEHEELLTLLARRWGDPQMISLWSAQERMIAGEGIAGGMGRDGCGLRVPSALEDRGPVDRHRALPGRGRTGVRAERGGDRDRSAMR